MFTVEQMSEPECKKVRPKKMEILTLAKIRQHQKINNDPHLNIKQVKNLMVTRKEGF